MSQLDPAPLNQNSPILPTNPYVNIPAANGRVSTNNNNAFLRAGCGGYSNYESIAASGVNNLTPLSAAINIPFSKNNQFQTGGYRYRKSIKKNSRRRGKGINYTKKTRLQKKKTNKKQRKYRKQRKQKNSKKYRKYQKGGSSLPLGSAPVGSSQQIPTSLILNNIPYSQGYSINEKLSTDYGALAQPIPINSYAQCPPKIKFAGGD